MFRQFKNKLLCKGNNSGIPRVIAVLPAKITSTIIGVIKPLSNLSKRKKIDFNFVIEHEVSDNVIEDKDLIIFCRNTEPNYSHLLDASLSKEIPIIYELDDNFWELPISSELGRYYRSQKRIRQLERYIKYADLVRVYSQPLYERIKEFNQNVYFSEAGVDFTLIPQKPVQRKINKIRIVYASGRGDQDTSFHLFINDLKRILDRYADKIEIIFWGHCPNEFKGHPSVIAYKIIPDYEEFFYKFARSNFDIGLAPLPNSVFYRSKSNNKFREYGACRIAGVYSRVDVYSRCIKNGKTGLLIDNKPGECFNAIEKLLFNVHLRNKIKKKAYDYIYKNYRQQKIEQNWIKHIFLVTKPKISHQNYSVIPKKQNWTGIHCRFNRQVSRISVEVLTTDNRKLRRMVGKPCNSETGNELIFEFLTIKNSYNREFKVRFFYNSLTKKMDRPEAVDIKCTYLY